MVCPCCLFIIIFIGVSWIILELFQRREEVSSLTLVLIFEKVPMDRSISSSLYTYKEHAMAFTLSQDYLTQVTVKGFRRDGTEAPLENVVFSVDTAPDDPLGPIVELTPDGVNCVITPVRVGTVQFKVEADARIGDGISLLTGLATIDVVPGEAVNLDIQFSEPYPRP